MKIASILLSVFAVLFLALEAPAQNKVPSPKAAPAGVRPVQGGGARAIQPGGRIGGNRFMSRFRANDLRGLSRVQLLALGATVADLAAVGFTQSEVVALGFSQAEVLSGFQTAGFVTQGQATVSEQVITEEIPQPSIFRTRRIQTIQPAPITREIDTFSGGGTVGVNSGAFLNSSAAVVSSAPFVATSPVFAVRPRRIFWGGYGGGIGPLGAGRGFHGGRHW